MVNTNPTDFPKKLSDRETIYDETKLLYYLYQRSNMNNDLNGDAFPYAIKNRSCVNWDTKCDYYKVTVEGSKGNKVFLIPIVFLPSSSKIEFQKTFNNLPILTDSLEITRLEKEFLEKYTPHIQDSIFLDTLDHWTDTKLLKISIPSPEITEEDIRTRSIKFMSGEITPEKYREYAKTAWKKKRNKINKKAVRYPCRQLAARNRPRSHGKFLPKQN